MPYLRRGAEENMTDSKTFVKITNKQIYDKLNSIDQKVSNMRGTVTYHTWAIGLIVLILMCLIGAIL